MAPKKRAERSASPAPKAKAGAKAKAKAEAKEDPKAKLEKEATEMFERFQADGKLDEALKLKEFAEIIRSVNTKYCLLWGDDPSAIIRKEWSNSGGNVKRELNLEEFKTWWLVFAEAANTEHKEKMEAAAAKEAGEKKAREEMFGHDGVWKCNLKQLNLAFDEAAKKGKTPLVIDNTEGFKTDTYFQYTNAHVLETKKWIMEKAKGGTVEAIFEEERERFFQKAHCFKYGQTVMFRLSNSAPDLKKTFNTELFPTLALLDRQQVSEIIGADNAKNVKQSAFGKMAPDEDEQLEFECMGAKDGFQVVVVTQFPEAEYEEFLKPMIPLELMQPILPSAD